MNYFEEARTRARRRRSPWNLVLIPAIVAPYGILWWGIVQLLQNLHARLYPGQTLTATGEGLGPILVAVAPLFAALVPAMLLGNALVRLISPARRALDQEADPFPEAQYKRAQRQLLRLGLYVVPTSSLMAILGTVLRWH